MAVQRDLPYPNQNFTVEIDGVVSAAFSEVVLPAIAIDAIEYRNGNDPESAARKLPGLAHYGNVTLRRGIVGSLDLYQWIDAARSGHVDRRSMSIILLSEDRTAVLKWNLLRAWPVKYSFGNLNAQGKEVAVEELVVAYEQVEMS